MTLLRALAGAWHAVLLLTVALAPAHVSAYRTASDLPEFQSTNRVALSQVPAPYELRWVDGLGLPASDLLGAVRAGAAVWSEPPCTHFQFSYGGAVEHVATPGDGRNTVHWLQSAWVGNGFSSDAAAVTDMLYVNPPEGGWTIDEADVHVNAQHFRWTTGGADIEAGVRDVQSVMTHELGHVLGLLHPCDAGDDPTAPPCSTEVGAENATMYPLYAGLEQRSLSSDDTAGVCDLYPCEGVDCGRDSPTDAPDSDPCALEMCSSAPCESGVHCAEGELCIDGACEVVVGLPGDLCTASADCLSGTCGSEQFCSSLCNEQTPCPVGMACDPSGMCTSELGPFGASCDFSNECITNLCVQSGDNGAVCTRRCGEHARCPAGFACREVDAEDVCVPRTGGCSVAGRPDGSSSWLLCAPLLFAGFRRRSRA